MEKAYKTLGIVLLFTLLPITIIGFLKTYLGQFPRFENNPGLAIHFHFAISAIWICLFIIQPILIRKKKFQLHRILGKASFLLILFLLTSFIPLFLKQIKYGFPPLMVLTITDVISVILFYSLGIYYRKNIGFHMRYMIVLALVFAMPAVGRIFSRWLELPFIENMHAGLLFEMLILSGLILWDRKNMKTYTPFITGIIFFLIRHISIYLTYYIST